jgi:ABC-type phosphate transport system substrate-binding protein
MPAGKLAYQGVDDFVSDQRLHLRNLARASNQLLIGKQNITIDMTLRANFATTTIVDPRIGYSSAVFPAMATTVNAASAIVAGIWFDTQKTGSIVAHHANSANTDQTIRFIIVG